MHPVLQKVTILLGCATLLPGCGKDNGPTSPQFEATRIPQQVTGVALITVPTIPESAERFSFSAIRHRNGQATGRFELFSEQNTGLRFNGIITCFTIEGSTARLGGITTKVLSSGVSVGDPWIWTVVDRGEGKAGLPDLVADFYLPLFTDQVQEFCDGSFDPGVPLQPIQRGNIQVQP